MSIQNLTLIAQIKKGQEENLRTILAKLKNDLLNGRQIGLETTESIHFARWIILDEWIGSGKTLPARLVFSNNFDGDPDKHLHLLCQKAGGLMDEIYSHCVGYPTTTVNDKVTYLYSLNQKAQAFYPGAPGRSLQEIKRERTLRNYIHDFISSNNWNNKNAQEVHKTIQEHVLNKDEFHWAKQPAKLPSMNWPALILVGIVLLALLPVIIIWILIVQFFCERKDIPLGLTPSEVPEKQIQKMEEYEDIILQNQFSQLLEVKPGKIRLITLKSFLFFAKVLVKLAFVKGKLMGIPTIHYARWVLIDNDQRLLFCSNYDGSWTQYLGDFIDKSGWGLTGIFSNSVGFPKAEFLLMKGAYDEEHFLAWSRYYQIETQLWYSAYPDLSIKNVLNNSLIRNELSSDLNEQDAQLFLARI
jgi:hypothetical protein